jgi:hypothetical protein
METLQCNDNIIYHPEYDINTGGYIDQCPIPPRQTRNYICHCFGGVNNGLFKNKTEYSYHVKLKYHRIYISNYAERINDLNTAKDYIKNLLKKNKDLEKDVAALKFQLAQVNKPSYPDPMIDLD